MMTAEQTDEEERGLGAVRRRKPSTAMNLSLFLAGLGQVYCGALRRGVLQMCGVGALVVGAMLALASAPIPPATVCWVGLGILLVITGLSAWDARRLALRTREDYRLKEYNTTGVYVALSFLFMLSVVGFAIVLRANFIHMFVMAGDSMAPTLGAGDRILVRKDAYRDRDPERNDLVAFLNPADRRQTWIKRVIGLPGDEIEVRAGQVFLNGEAYEEVPAVEPGGQDLPPTTVPENHCFVLGDNRANSRDSRYIGPVPMIALVGKLAWVR